MILGDAKKNFTVCRPRSLFSIRSNGIGDSAGNWWWNME